MRDRSASETEEKRAARLQQMSANQSHRLAAETGSEREARLHQPHRTSCAAPAALHALAHPSHSSSRLPPQCCAFT